MIGSAENPGGKHKTLSQFLLGWLSLVLFAKPIKWNFLLKIHFYLKTIYSLFFK